MKFADILSSKLPPDRNPLDVPDNLPGDVLANDGIGWRLCRHGSWNVAAAAARAALATPGLVALIGARQSGKSVLLRFIGLELTASGLVVRAWHAGDPADADDCDVLLVDDADELPAGLLRKLARGHRVCFAAGSRAWAEQLDPRAGRLAIIELEPMALKDARELVDGKLRALGQAPGTLTEAGLAALHRDAQGAPGTMLEIASLAAFLAQLEGSEQVGIVHVAAATRSARETDVPEERAQAEARPAPGARLAPGAQPGPEARPGSEAHLGRGLPSPESLDMPACVSPGPSGGVARHRQLVLPVLVLLLLGGGLAFWSASQPNAASLGGRLGASETPLGAGLPGAPASQPEPVDVSFANPAPIGSFVLAQQPAFVVRQPGAHHR